MASSQLNPCPTAGLRIFAIEEQLHVVCLRTWFLNIEKARNRYHRYALWETYRPDTMILNLNFENQRAKEDKLKNS